MKSFWKNISPGVLRDTGIRLALLGVFAGSMALVWWSVNRLRPLEKALEEQNGKVSKFEDDVFQLESRWNAAEAERIGKASTAARERLFSGPDELNGWQQELKQQSGGFTLSVSPQPPKTQPSPLPSKRFVISAASVDLKAPALGIATNSPYQQLLNFTQSLTTQKRRVDLVEFSVSGRSNSVSEARVGIQMWSQESVP
ncbi:MAG TPA: hypothetical protein VI454_08565 [Verrucomicrobiae bacterium]|jgi:hypothetical protein